MRWFRTLPQHYKTLYSALLVGVAITLVVLVVLQGLPFFANAERSAYDFHFTTRLTRPKPTKIVLVTLDQTTLADKAHNNIVLPRHYTAKAINYLCKAKPKAIGLDFLYIAKQTPSDDRALAGALKKCGKVVVASEIQEAADVNNPNVVVSGTHYEAPIPTILKSSAGAGVANVPQDPDGIVRSADLIQYGASGERYPSLALKVASVAEGKSANQVASRLPQQGMLINWVGPDNPFNRAELPTFYAYQMDGIIDGQGSPADFKNKIVMVIPAALPIRDLVETPLGTMYGGTVQANILNTILNQDPITPAGSTTNNIIVLILGLLTTVVAARLGIISATAGTLLVAIGYAGLTFLLFNASGIWINLIIPEVTIFLVFAGIMALRFATEERIRRKTGKIFGQYVPPDIVDVLVSAPDEELALQGARRPMTLLFIDIRGFTAMSERMEPEQVVSALDVYLQEVTTSVQEFQGTVNKYVGDELVAMWNAPAYNDDHALLAVRAGMDMVDRMDKINQDLVAKGLPMIRYGIGINTGDAVVGQMGSSFRKQYDVIGDAVNTGARLCSAAAGGEVIIGQETWELIGNWLEVEETEPLRLKGKSQPLRTFRVIQVKEYPAELPEVIPATV